MNLLHSFAMVFLTSISMVLMAETPSKKETNNPQTSGADLFDDGKSNKSPPTTATSSKTNATTDPKADKKAQRKDAKNKKKADAAESAKASSPIVIPTKMPKVGKAKLTTTLTKKQQDLVKNYNITDTKTQKTDVFALLNKQAANLKSADSASLAKKQAFVESLITDVKVYWLKTALGQVDEASQKLIITFATNVKALQSKLPPPPAAADASATTPDANQVVAAQSPTSTGDAGATGITLIPVVSGEPGSEAVTDKVPDPALYYKDPATGNILKLNADGTASPPTIVAPQAAATPDSPSVAATPSAAASGSPSSSSDKGDAPASVTKNAPSTDAAAKSDDASSKKTKNPKNKKNKKGGKTNRNQTKQKKASDNAKPQEVKPTIDPKGL